MFSHAFTLFGLLAFSSAGLLEPSRLYIPSQQQSIRTSQIPAVSLQLPVGGVTRTEVQSQQIGLESQSQVPVQHVTSGDSIAVPVAQQVTASQQQSVNTNTLVRTAVQPAAPAAPIRQIAIVRLANENVGDGTYSYNYETENGITAEEHGQSDAAGTEAVERVQGSYSFVAPDNIRYTVTYVADENGFRAEGAHLPVPPTPIAQAPQVTRTVVDTRSTSSGVHVIPTSVISTPLQVFQRPVSQQVPVVQSQNVLRQTVVPASLTVHQGSYAQQTGAQQVQGQSSLAVQGTSGYSGSVHTQVLQRQSVVPVTAYTSQQTGVAQQDVLHQSTVQVQPSSYTSQQTGVVQQDVLHQNTVQPSINVQPSYTAQQTGVSGVVQQDVLHQSTVQPSSYVSQQTGVVQQDVVHQSTVQPISYTSQQTGVVQQDVIRQSTVQPISYTSQQNGVVQQDVLHQSTIQPSTITVQPVFTSQQTGVTGVQQDVLHQSTVQPSISVQPAYTSQQIGVSGVHQDVLHQSTIQPSTIIVQPAYTSQQIGVTEAQQNVLRQNTIQQQQVQQGFIQTGVSNQQGVLQRQASVPAVPVPQQAVQHQQEVVHAQNSAVPSTVTVRQGSQQVLHQQQNIAPSRIATVNTGTVGIIKQQGIQEFHAPPTTQQQTSGQSSSHVTVQLGTSGYATEQVGDSSTVQILEGSVPVNTASVQQTVQPATVQTTVTEQNQQVQSQTAVPTNQQQVTSQGTSGSQQGVVLPDGTTHYGY